MRFTINREYFDKALSIASKAIGSKSPVPVMMNLKLTLKNGVLSILGSNNELTIKTDVLEGNADKKIIYDIENGATLIAAKYLTDIVKKIEGDYISFEIIDETIVTISDNRSNFKLNSIRADEYPEIDLDDAGTSFEVSVNDFKLLVDQTAFAASQKEQRPVLTAVNLNGGSNLLIATATDSARLARKEIGVKDVPFFSANVPAKVLVEVEKLLEGKDKVQISVSEQKILFKFDNTVVSSRLISGDYPNTKNIIPHSFSYFLTVNAQELLSAMDRVSLLLVEKENVVKLTMSDQGVEVSAKSNQIGSAIEQINIYQYNSDRLEVSFNATYVADAIKACRSEDVSIEFLGEMKPFVVRNTNDESQVQLITPMRTYN
ncbi:MAG: DNA polymerase III subunit beta [Bacilli bacterium]|nr:DNA polymerase III subunit beta [Bacilli bacterium]